MFALSAIVRQVCLDLMPSLGEGTYPFAEMSRGFGFIRFSSIEDSKAFVERNYPNIHLYGSKTTDNDDEAAKVRIAFSRERDDRARGEKADGEWTCKIVRHTRTLILCSVALLTSDSAHLSISPAEPDATDARHHRLVPALRRFEARRADILRYEYVRPGRSGETSIYEQWR